MRPKVNPFSVLITGKFDMDRLVGVKAFEFYARKSSCPLHEDHFGGDVLACFGAAPDADVAGTNIADRRRIAPHRAGDDPLVDVVVTPPAAEQIYVTKKVEDEGLGRVFVDIFGGADLLDAGLVHHHHPVGHFQEVCRLFRFLVCSGFTSCKKN